jgi:hypothetical protein
MRKIVNQMIIGIGIGIGLAFGIGIGIGILAVIDYDDLCISAVIGIYSKGYLLSFYPLLWPTTALPMFSSFPSFPAHPHHLK